jgi:PAS domain S-box-containing protein
MELRPGTESHRAHEVKPDEVDPIRRALHVSKEWYQDLIEQSQDLLCMHDLEGRLLSVNPASARLLEYSVQEMLEIPMREHVAPEFRAEFDIYLEEIHRVGQAHGLLVVITRSGKRRIWEYSNTLRRQGTAPAIVSGVARDVTEQRRIESLLREANELNSQVIASVGEGVVVYNRELRCVAWNPFMEQLMGIPASAALGKPYHELVPSELRGHDPKAVLGRALRGEVITVPDENITAPDGSRRWICSRKGPLRNAQGEITGVIVTLLDITERRKAEERLREYEKVVEGLEESIIVVDHERRYVIANRTFLSRRGLQKEQIIGRPVLEQLASEGASCEMLKLVKEKMDECFRGKLVQYELKYKYPMVGEREISLSYFPIAGQAGITRIACVIQDITERKKSRQSLDEYKKAVEGVEDMIVVLDRE